MLKFKRDLQYVALKCYNDNFNKVVTTYSLKCMNQSVHVRNLLLWTSVHGSFLSLRLLDHRNRTNTILNGRVEVQDFNDKNINCLQKVTLIF